MILFRCDMHFNVKVLIWIFTKSFLLHKTDLVDVKKKKKKKFSAPLHSMLSFCSSVQLYSLGSGLSNNTNRHHVLSWWLITSSSWRVNCSDSTTHLEVNDPWYTWPSAVAASWTSISSTCQTNWCWQHPSTPPFSTLLADRRSQSTMLLTPRTTSASSNA